MAMTMMMAVVVMMMIERPYWLITPLLHLK
jgi:hypothetical protein